VSAGDARYDVIVGDVIHPARDGAGSLYTVEHFQAIRRRLAPGGLFCQWIPLYQHDLETFLSIARAFLAEFGDARLLLSHFNVSTPAVALVGGGSVTARAGYFDERVGDPELRRQLRLLDLTSDYDLFGTQLAGSGELARLAGQGDVNRDDWPIVTFRAPRRTYESHPPFEVLQALLDRGVTGDTGAEPQQPFEGGLRRFVAARDLYLRGEIDWMTGRQREAIEKHLAGVRVSAEFRAAYDMLLARARSAVKDRSEARRILETLQAVRPDRHEAGWLLSSFR
jgi:spermidine synthase